MRHDLLTACEGHQANSGRQNAIVIRLPWRTVFWTHLQGLKKVIRLK